jgi:penicillin-binding protein 1C
VLLSDIFFVLFTLISWWGQTLAPKSKANVATEVLDRRGERIGYLDFRFGVKPLLLSEIPREQVQLVLKAEDRRFYEHAGIDWPRLMRAGLGVVTGDFQGGASTITQQWVRMQSGLPRTWWAKPLVMGLAVYVERLSDKDAILEAYLNHIPYSEGVEGLGAAAEYYFSKPLVSLSPGEMATLAALIRAPSGLSHPRAAKRLKALRDELVAGNTLATSEEITLKRKRSPSTAFAYLQNLKKNKGSSERIETTLDLVLQRELQDTLALEIARLNERGVRHGALAVLDARTGDVLAYVGSADYFKADAGQIDGLQVARQPGSLIKAFTYALAFEQGYSGASILPDTPSIFRSGAGMYRPRNYDESFSGPRRAREALANSLNLPAVMLNDRIGPHQLHDALGRLGIPLSREVDFYGVGLTLGNAEMKPLHLLEAFSVFARQNDTWVKARWLKHEKIHRMKSPIGRFGAWMVSDVLKDRHARMGAFGERTVFDVPFDMAAKTGTSTDYRDNWTIAWTTEHVVLAWVGNHDQKPMQRVSGITGAGPLARAAMQAVRKNSSATQFTPPELVQTERICATSGMLAGKDCPEVVLEKFRTTHVPGASCDWHRFERVMSCTENAEDREVLVTQYPEEYQRWAHDHNESIESQVKRQCPHPDVKWIATKQTLAAQIEYPLDGAVFAIDPDLPLETQTLTLRMSARAQDLHWEINGADEGSESNQHWQLTRGRHQIRLVDEAGSVVDEVKVFVR